MPRRDWAGDAARKLAGERERDTVEVNLVHEARALLEQWRLDCDNHRLQSSFYEGAIYGLNKYLENLGGSEVRKSSKPRTGETEAGES